CAAHPARAQRASGPLLLAVLAFVLARLALVARGHLLLEAPGRRRGERGGGLLLLALEEVGALLVETREHVVTGLEHGVRAGVHDVVLRVLVGAEDRAEVLAVLVGERDAQVRRVEAEALQVAGRLGHDVGAAQVAEVVQVARDGVCPRLLLSRTLDAPAAALGPRHRGAVPGLPPDDELPAARRVEAEDRLVAELRRGLLEAAQRPVADRVDVRLVVALGVDLLRLAAALAADEELPRRLGGVLLAG